jgi:chemotaxis-related protein WspB
MLFLLFEVGPDRYAFDAGQVAEVLPLVRIKPVLQPPPGVSGLFSYRGVPVPVIDLCQLTLGRPAAPRLSTRLILVHYPDGRGTTRLLGLVAEHVVETLRRDADDFQPSGIGDEHAACSGRVITDSRGVIQWLDVNRLLPAATRDALFNDGGGA